MHYWICMATDITLIVNNHIKTLCLIRLCTKLPTNVIKKTFLYISIFIIRSGKFDFGPVNPQTTSWRLSLWKKHCVYKQKTIHTSHSRKINLFIWVMMFNATFSNISVISLRSVLLVEETGVPRENHRSAAIHWQTNHKMLYWVQPRLRGPLI